MASDQLDTENWDAAGYDEMRAKTDYKMISADTHRTYYKKVAVQKAAKKLNLDGYR